METTTHQSTQSPKPSGKQATLDYQKTLEHLIWMASLKGAKQYAWDRAQKLNANSTGSWRGIAADLTKAMNEKSSKNGQKPD
jgi:hypothetical protein